MISVEGGSRARGLRRIDTAYDFYKTAAPNKPYGFCGRYKRHVYLLTY